jgi:hypothetical protein
MISQAEGALDSRSSEEPVHEIGRLKASHESVAQISLACNTPSREPARLGSGLITFAYYANIPFNFGFVNS